MLIAIPKKMNFRKYKITYQIFNFFKRNQLKHNKPLYAKYGLKKHYFSSVSSEDFRGLKSPLNIYDSNDSAIKMPDDMHFKPLDKDVQSALTSWSKNGYVILKNFFTESEVEKCNEEIHMLIGNKTLKFRYINKIMFAFHRSKLVYRMGTDKKYNTPHF